MDEKTFVELKVLPANASQPNVTSHSRKSSAKTGNITLEEHSLSIEDVAVKFGTHLMLNDLKHSLGLSSEVAGERLQMEGPNALTPPKKKPLWMLYVLHFTQLFNVLLIVSGVLSFILYAIDNSSNTNLILGIILLLVVVLNSGIELFQEYKTESILESFLSLVPLQSMVIRDGRPSEVHSTDLVRGDLISIRDGQKVPADMRIVSCTRDLKVDNSSITGESEAQERKTQISRATNPLDASNLLFSGTMVVSGEGLGIVIRTGDRSVLGQIAKLTIQGKPRASQLSREINLFVRKIAAVAILTALIFFTYGLVKGLGIGVTFSFAIGVFTAFVPQGLPATVTMLLALSAKRLSQKKVLVKDLHGVETLGSITLLASDKTGTLTQNKMQVVASWCGEQFWPLSSEIDFELLQKEAPGFSDLVTCSMVCSRARIIKEGEYSGDATEVGLLKFGVETVSGDLEKYRASYPKEFEIPFNSANKWHLTVHRVAGIEGGLMLLKGAPERVLSKCTHFVNREDRVLSVDENFQLTCNHANAMMAEGGKRVLAFAKKSIAATEIERLEQMEVEEIAKDFCFVGLLGLMDPPKKGVRKAVAACQTAGIQVVMVTGDQPLTAESIARQVGIVQGCTKEAAAIKLGKSPEQVTEEEYEAVIVHGDQLGVFSDADWDRALVKKEIIFARTSPKQKLEIVTRFQAMGHIVGASGDGVNDAPALKKADLGISMNHTASDVSKEAANMILLDDNFVSIVSGIAEGRLIFSNLKKSIRYTLTHIMPEVLAGLVFIIFMVPLPMGSLLILIFDLGIELMPAISFSFEAAEEDLMLVPPRKVLTSVKQQTVNDIETQRQKKLNFWRKLWRRVKSWFTQKGTGEMLVDNDLLLWCYMQGGLIEAAGCFAGYLIALTWLHVPLNASASKYFKEGAPPLRLTNGQIANAQEQIRLAGSAQAAFFLCLIIVQWFNLFLSKQRFKVEPQRWWRNYYAFLGMLVGGIIGVCVVYIPGLNDVVFGIAPAPAIVLCGALAGGLVLVSYEVVRRFLRRKGFFGGIPKRNVNLLEMIRTTSSAKLL